MKKQEGWDLRRASCLAAVVCVLAVVGCGGSDDPEPAAEGSSTASASEDERAVEATVDEVAAHFRAGRAGPACELMTPATQRQFAAAAAQLAAVDADAKVQGSIADATCADTLGAILASDKLVEDLTPRIVDVTVDGDRAVVTADVAHDKQNDQQATLVRSGDQWKVAAWFQEG